MHRPFQLADVLAELARTLTTDFDLESILDRLVDQVAHVLPVTAAGVTLVGPGPAPRQLAASNDAGLRWEQLQAELGEGPCVAASTRNTAVLVPDLSEDAEFPHFSSAAVAQGLAAVFTFPLRHGDEVLGALDLYRDVTGPFDPDLLAAAQTLADVASAYLANATGRSDLHRAVTQLTYDSHHDPLTGLANRVLLQQRLATEVAAAGSGTVVLFLDLDGFKSVNDTHGHAAGDGVLVETARRLSRVVRPADTVARASGDEFIVLCRGLTAPDGLPALVRRVEGVFATPFVLTDPPVEVRVAASIGVAHTTVDEPDGDTLVAEADRAMYAAKRRGAGKTEVRDVRDLARPRRGASLSVELRSALDTHGLDLAYQPVVRCSDGAVTGVEALLRWTHPRLGRVDPFTAVAAAEQTDLILDLGAWVLTRACRDHARWRGAHPDHRLELAVNVSPRQIVAQGFPDRVAEVLGRTRTPAGSLVVEVTEQVLLEDDPGTTRILGELAELGVQLALDDFGTGYAALGYLSRLPLDVLKIDRSLTERTGTARGDAVLRAVVDLGHAVGTRVTLEGVETEQQAGTARDVGCDAAQGYHYGRPVPAAGIADLLAGTPTPLTLPAPAA